jgi:hypothetical protein
MSVSRCAVIKGMPAEHAAFSSLALSQRKFRRSKSPLATLKTDKGPGNGEAANCHAERSVVEGGDAGSEMNRFRRIGEVTMIPGLMQSHEPALGDLEYQA